MDMPDCRLDEQLFSCDLQSFLILYRTFSSVRKSGLNLSYDSVFSVEYGTEKYPSIVTPQKLSFSFLYFSFLVSTTF